MAACITLGSGGASGANLRHGHATPESLGRFALGIGTQFGLVFAAAIAYFGVRGLTEGSEAGAVSNAQGLLGVEHALHLDVEASVQGWILDYQSIVTAANWVYIWGHWPVIISTFVWLYRRHRCEYFRLRNAMFVSGAIGLVIFALFPMAPPRLLPSGFVDTVTDNSNAYRVLQPPQLVNKFAAMPSLHVGWNLLVGIMIYRTAASRAARSFGMAIPALMTTAVVLTANHYVVDAIVGAVVALIGLAVVSRLRHVMVQRRPAHLNPADLPRVTTADQLSRAA